MNDARAKKLVLEDPDFIALKRFGYSLKKLLKRYPEGCPDRLAAAALMVTEDEYHKMYERAVVKLRAHMKVST